MTTYGSIREFTEGGEAFEDYVDRLDAYMEANNVAQEQKVNVFISSIGPKAFKLLKNLCTPEHPKNKQYVDLCRILKGHYSPAPITIAERFKFWTAAQGTDEKVADFIVRLKTLSCTCSFGNSWRKHLETSWCLG